MIDGYEAIFCKNLYQIRKHISNDQIRNEILKMLKNIFKENSVLKLNDFSKKNVLITTIEKWWNKDKYQLGLHKCINKIDELISVK